ncbi:hypothetical protein NP493_135g03002 [Ridgeia piscesae]|uniref:Peptidase S72 domain-containing protein n=1 Tax=Ridgeia piscesae TaxID=27915 RepID=A0AAD9P556_RIDPI|nr:hypothetical protein NP493_135g03002 [Ridgeia piscesae]
MLIIILPVLLLVPPTCSDTWWNSVDVIFGLSHRSIPYPRSEGGSGRQEQEEDAALVTLLGIADTTATVGRIFEYRIRNNAFLGNISHLTVREVGRLNLPHWMFFNNTANTFLGLPTDLDKGSTVIEVTAHSGDHRVTASFVIDVKPANQLHPTWSHDIAAQPLRFLQDGDIGRRNNIISAAPERPRLMNPIHKILVQLGNYFEFPVPADTFYDTQDGDTTRLSLRLVTINNSSLPSSSWIQLDASRQVVFGLPLRNDVSELPAEYVLMASNSHGLTAVAAIQVVIDTTILDGISHRFIVTFRLNYSDFMRTRLENLKVIVKKLDAYYDDISSVDSYSNSHVSVTDLREGSVQMAWTNTSVSKTSCENETIKELFLRMSHNGSLSDKFRRFMLPQAPVIAVGLDLLGVCGVNGSSPEGGAGVDGVSSTDGLIWLVTIIPALIVVVLIAVIILIMVIRNKRRSQRGRYLPDSEKPIFGKNRKPVLMPEEMEMLDLGLRPKKPVTMPTDNQNFYTNAAYESDPVPPPPYQQPGSLPHQGVSPPVYDVTGMCNTPPPTYRLPPPYVANSNDTVLL